MFKRKDAVSVICQLSDNIVTSLGFTTDDNLKALEGGCVGLKSYSEGCYGLQFPFVASIMNADKVDDKFEAISKEDLSHYTRFEKIAIISVYDAIERAGIRADDERTLFIISTTKGNVGLIDDKVRGLFEKERVYLWRSAEIIAGFFGNMNKPVVVSNACISGVTAQIIAKRYLEFGDYENVVVVGADVLSKFVISGFQSFLALSPEQCKPFDKYRQGLNLGEGAATIIYGKRGVDSLSSKNYIELRSGSITNDANHISGPHRNAEGMKLAIEKTIDGIDKNSLGFINAHGTATMYNDEMEALAFYRCELNKVPIVSFKGYFGHTLGAAGVLESVVACNAMKRNRIYKNVGYSDCGTTNRLNIITDNKFVNSNSCLKTISGFGGCNAAILFVRN